MPHSFRRHCLRLLPIVVALGVALGVCSVATGCANLGPGGGAGPGFFENVAGGMTRLGEHMRSAGAAIAPASPQVGALLLATGGGLGTIGTMWGAALLRRRLGPVPAAIAAAWRGPSTPDKPASASTTSTAPVDAVNPAQPGTANAAGMPSLASTKSKRKRARRRVAAAPFSARIAPQQTSGRAAA